MLPIQSHALCKLPVTISYFASARNKSAARLNLQN